MGRSRNRYSEVAKHGDGLSAAKRLRRFGARCEIMLSSPLGESLLWLIRGGDGLTPSLYLGTAPQH